MPPRKEPKEQVVYPSSKAKTPAYKPLRPTKIAQTSTTESESSTSRTKPTFKRAGPTAKWAAASKSKQNVALASDMEDDDGDQVLRAENTIVTQAASDSEESDSLPPLTAAATMRQSTGKRKASAMSVDLTNSASLSMTARTHVNDDLPPPPSPSDNMPSIPQPLLLRLLHAGFSHQDTKIDTHALQIVQTYMEVFVREAIARCVAEKREAAERGEVEEGDVRWLELQDLEKVGVGMMLDF